MKIIIGSIHDGGNWHGASYSDIAELTQKSTIDYCKTQGYYTILENESLDKNRHISWGKICLIKKHLKNCDWFWSVDVDLLIMNHTIRLENLIDLKYDIIISCYDEHINGFNAGSFIIKNTEWSHCFLKEIYEDEEFLIERPDVLFENAAIIKYYKNHPEDHHRFKIMHMRSINSHFHAGVESRGFNYKHGDFCVHLCGMDNNYRIKTLSEFQKYIIRPDPNFDVAIWNKI